MEIYYSVVVAYQRALSIAQNFLGYLHRSICENVFVGDC